MITNIIKKVLFISLLFCASAFAANNYDNENEIEKFYFASPNFINLPIAQKVILASNLFLGKPYKLSALGEGSDGAFDQNPLYRTDTFDCMTFVSTVLALAKSSNLQEFQKQIKLINYKNGEVSYFNRLHFTNPDWNQSNQNHNVIQDYTLKIVSRKQKPIAVMSQTIIDKPHWYIKKNIDSIKLNAPVSIETKKNLLAKMHSLATQAKNETSKIYYLPLEQLFFPDGTPNDFFFNQIPSPAIIEIVTPNNNTYINTIGTAIDVSHMGLLLKINGKLIFREASSSKKFGVGIIDIPLEIYLKNYIHSKTVKGIHVEKILE